MLHAPCFTATEGQLVETRSQVHLRISRRTQPGKTCQEGCAFQRTKSGGIKISVTALTPLIHGNPCCNWAKKIQSSFTLDVFSALEVSRCVVFTQTHSQTDQCWSIQKEKTIYRHKCSKLYTGINAQNYIVINAQNCILA